MGGLLKLLVVVHEVLFIVLLVSDVEQQSNLQFAFRSFQGFSFGIVILAKSIVAACFVGIILLRFGSVSISDQFFVDLDGLSEYRISITCINPCESYSKPTTNCFRRWF